jgi:hypothetical protein
MNICGYEFFPKEIPEAFSVVLGAILGWCLAELSNYLKSQRETNEIRQRRATGLFFDTMEIINDIRPLAFAYLNQLNDLNLGPTKQLFEKVEPIIGARHRPLDFDRENLLILTEMENGEFLNELFRLRRLQNELVEFAENYKTSRTQLLSKMAAIKPPVTGDDEVSRMSFDRSEIAHLDLEVAMLSSLTAHLMNIAEEASTLATDVAKRIGPLLRGMFKKGIMKIELDLEEAP